MLSDYTTPSEVRAVLQVSPEELSDESLATRVFETSLLEDLYAINVNLPDNFATVVAITNPSSAEVRFINLLRLFSSYSVAKTFLSAIEDAVPRRITDGRAEVERTTNQFTDLRISILALYDRWRNALIALYNTLFPSDVAAVSSALTFMSSTGLASDPVTNA